MPVTLGRELDPATGLPTGRWATLEPAELTRHAVCVGMTGSGKTGLGVGLIEAVALLGVPVLAIDPKGDLGNLALVLDPARPESFLPWIDAAEAARHGRSVEEHAAAVAAAHARGLAEDGIGPEELTARREKVEVIVHTPGSESGVPIDVLTALTRAPAGLQADPEGLREYVTGAVGALLGLLGLGADPLTDARAILLARLLGDAFAAGEALPLEALLPRVVDPPFATLGHFAVDEVLPPEDRTALALSLNHLAASPAFRAWSLGVPLDLDAWMAPTQDGRTPIRVVSLAHLGDRERLFAVTLLLQAVVAWSRRLPGTGGLRAVLYFDEVTGYLPPHPKDPPSKSPALTLLKQARAVGLGVVLATQNPVDVDYEALSNAGTWFVGRLQTRQDRRRVVEGLASAVGELDAAAVDDALGRLPRRAFVWRTADDAAPRWLRTRQVRCWLRGPLTRREIASLGQTWTAAPTRGAWLAEPPPLPPHVPCRWLTPEGHAALGLEPGDGWRAGLYLRLSVRFDEPGFREERVVHRWLPPGAAEPVAVALADAWLARAALPGDRYAPVDRTLWAPERRERWVDQVISSEVARGPRGVVRPDAGDVAVLGWAIVWTRCSAG